MSRLTILLSGVLLATGVMSFEVKASDRHGPVRVWVEVEAQPGEGRWDACRRIFQGDVDKVRGTQRDTVRCWVPFSRANEHDATNMRFYDN